MWVMQKHHDKVSHLSRSTASAQNHKLTTSSSIQYHTTSVHLPLSVQPLHWCYSMQELVKAIAEHLYNVM